MMLMYRVASSALVLALAMAVFPHGATAQYAGDPTENRAPRFLLAMAERSQPVPVDLKRSAFLRRPLSLAFDGATLKQALAEISRQAGLSLVYADDVLPAGMLVNLRAERITVAAALTDVLLGAGVDIVFTPEGRATLVKRPEGEPALQGAVPGLLVQRSSGQPGVEGFSLNVRGVSSVPSDKNKLFAANGGNSPLVLIDGIPGNLDLLNPADIQSIDVLKDAAASIYGARAANGVFLVTTRKGRRGAPTVTYSSNVATTHLAGMMDTPNNYQMAVMDNEANIHAGGAQMYTPDLLARVKAGDPNPIPHPLYASSGWMLFFTNTDWRRAVFENGFEHKQTLTVSGGGPNSAYYLSGTYADQQGVIRYGDDGNKRYNLRLNFDYDVSERIRLESKLALDNQDMSDIGGIGAQRVMVETIFGMPNHPIYTQGGQHFFAQGGWGNAVAQAEEAATAHFNTRSVSTNFKAIVNVVEGLRLNLQAGIDYRTQNNTDIGKSFPLYRWDNSGVAYYSIANPDQNWVTRSDSEGTHRNYIGYVQYSRLFADKHQVEIMAGASHEDSDIDQFNAGRSDFLNQDVWGLGLGSSANMSNNGGGEHWTLRSGFSRLSYMFKNKYMLDANLRWDGSSRFAPGHRWGFFPGVAVAWRVSEGPFGRRLATFDKLKP